jgi:hypothetical protein
MRGEVMEELQISIEILTEKKEDIQREIFHLFQYNAWPSDSEFLSIGGKVAELGQIERAAGELRECLDAVKGNNECEVT